MNELADESGQSQMQMFDAHFLESDTPGWEDVPTLPIGTPSCFDSQQQKVGIRKNGNQHLVLDIHAKDEITCFSGIQLFGSTVAIGFGETVHFLDLANLLLQSRKLDSYFGYIYAPADFNLESREFAVLVASGYHLHHFTHAGEEIWRSAQLGIDGVIVQDVVPPTIIVSGEWDPPGGWKNARVNIADGVTKLLGMQ